MISRIQRSIRRRSGIALRFMLAHLERPRWIRRPRDLSKTKVCLLASFTRDAAASCHALMLCEAWHAQGFKVVLIVATDEPSRFEHDNATTPWLDGLMVRRNVGYDFGSWSTALAALPEVRDAELLALANDSVYGPLRGFEAMLARVHASTGEIIGVTESFERVHHIQSFLVFYKNGALRSAAFDRFWNTIPSGDRQDVIIGRELRFLFDMQMAGLKVHVLFAGERDTSLNPTLSRWRELLDAGFPFVKVQLLRENPMGADISGWDIELRDRGYAPANVVRHLGNEYSSSAAAHAIGPS